MDRPDFARTLRHAIVGALAEFRRRVPDESPYAFAIILGQCGDYLGYAVATEEGLRWVAAEYAARGYRDQGCGGEERDNLERLAEWLRWANPDDGWTYGDFPDGFGIAPELAILKVRAAKKPALAILAARPVRPPSGVTVVNGTAGTSPAKNHAPTQ